MLIHHFLFTSFFSFVFFFLFLSFNDAIVFLSNCNIWYWQHQRNRNMTIPSRIFSTFIWKMKNKNCQSCNKGIVECRKSNIALSFNTSLIYLTIQQARRTIKSISRNNGQVPCWLISKLLLSLLLLSNTFIWNWIIQKREKHISNDLYCILKIKNAKVSLINFIIVEHVMIGR